MTEDDVKTIRHSFSNPNEKSRFTVNRFGHTVLVDEDGNVREESNPNVLEHEQMVVQVNGAGDIEASGKADLWSHPALLQYAERQGFDSSVLRASQDAAQLPAEEETEPADAPCAADGDLYDRLSSSLDDLNRDVESLLHIKAQAVPAPPVPPLAARPEPIVAADPPASSPAPAPMASVAPALSDKTCTDANCRAPLPAGARFCPECGKAQLVNFCGSCGYQYQGLERFCPECGAKR